MTGTPQAPALLPAQAKQVALAGPAPLAATLNLLDEQLTALSSALQGRDAQALQGAADHLVAALEAAGPVLREPGALTPALRRQLAYAVGRVAAHREALARATASVDRAIEVLLPPPVPAAGTYSASGYAERAAATGSAWA
jgi:ABC-type transporter Mla subunit MlaD